LGIVRRKYFNGPGILNRIKVMKKAVVILGHVVDNQKITDIYSNTAAVWVGALLAKKKKLRHYWHLHEIIVRPFWFSYLMGNIINYAADKVIVVSGAVRDYWKKHIDPKKLELVYNGIDYTPYLNPGGDLKGELLIEQEACVIGMIGRVNSWKGHEYFLEISEELNKKFLNLRFILVGDAFPGEEHLYEGLEKKILEKKFKNRVFNLGFRSDISSVLATLDIFVLPSTLPAPFPTVILEAMAAGKPVIATAHGGAVEMISNDETGILIPWDSPREAADKMASMVADKNKRKRMGELGRKKVLENFSLTSYRENINNVFSPRSKP
jgi:glycosyltransferase involved in cell wall biosynthesis